MIVTFICECEKKALARTRKVLDAFANRIGSRTWQTVITDEGLNAVKKLLRKTASRNTAVACHLVKTRKRSILLWVVGNHGKFNNEGVVPVNITQKNSWITAWENQWKSLPEINIITALAALLHDIGKATKGFQKKLENSLPQRDPYRHEWISLRLFQAMIHGCENDEVWLTRLSHFNDYQEKKPGWHKDMINDAHQKPEYFDTLPPLARVIGWLIVTHHRLPFYEGEVYKNRNEGRNDNYYWRDDIDAFYKILKPAEGWVKDTSACQDIDDINDFWTFRALPTKSLSWQKTLAFWCDKALNHPPLLTLSPEDACDPFLLHMARLSLMLGDHNYSSLPAGDRHCVRGDSRLESLAANTDRDTGKTRQTLDSHLRGVAKFASRIVRLLPEIARGLPAVQPFSSFKKPTSTLRFLWQNTAFNLARELQKETREQGFFGINLASTGCGKTIGNARIMAGLGDPDHGPRFTVALGLRVLTLQTGQALRERMRLDRDQLAILVGNTDERKLFEARHNDTPSEQEEFGSESASSLVDGMVCGQDNEEAYKELGTIIADARARALLLSPVVACTVDHIINATESLRGGRQIVPMLRLLSSDLVLDEPDDFNKEDLPALARLVFFAGLLGSRVLLSSATITPDFAGLFNAYRAGRAIWNRHHGIRNNKVICAWFDEKRQTHTEVRDKPSFETAHERFVKKRAQMLSHSPTRRMAGIIPVSLPGPLEWEEVNFHALAAVLMDSAHTLHTNHYETCPHTGKKLSVGLIRIATIRHLVPLAQAFLKLKTLPWDTTVHLCCYHARQLFSIRNYLEMRLDTILSRHDESALFGQPEIKEALEESSTSHHVFIVLGSPVTEVGRDHSYSWAIVEPSSMRSIIQLAGRVWRHQPDKIATDPNVLIMEANIKALAEGDNTGVGKAVFTHPGFEDKNFMLESHRISELIPPEQLKAINAIPRIIRPETLKPKTRLADLEHAVLNQLLNPSETNFVTAFWERRATHLSGHLQKISPFRRENGKKENLVAIPDDDQTCGISFVTEENAWKQDNYGLNGSTDNKRIQYRELPPCHRAIKPWLMTDVQSSLKSIMNELNETDMKKIALRYATISLKSYSPEPSQTRWYFNPFFGFWKKE